MPQLSSWANTPVGDDKPAVAKLEVAAEDVQLHLIVLLRRRESASAG
jgi:hypothetical protein